MKEFTGKVAVVTGAASGLGRAMAQAFAAEGAKVVLADVEETPLRQAEQEMRESGAEVLAVRTDVAKNAEVEALAEKAFGTFGAVHIVVNNAGVALGKATWETTLADWEWLLGVNLWGVIHGVHTFVPRMLAQGEEGHVVNTASVAGFLSSPGLVAYNVSKHAVVTLSETLYFDLQQRGAKIGVSVLCPAWVNTGIADAERNRPDALKNPPVARTEEEKSREESIRAALRSGKLSPADVADLVLNAIRHEKFYILPHTAIKPAISIRMEDILEERNPNPVFWEGGRR